MRFLDLAVLLLAGCAAPVVLSNSPPPATPDITTVRSYRDFETTIHADVDFDSMGREILDRSADRLRVFTSGRARVHIVYDLDFTSVISIHEHIQQKHSMLFVVFSGGPVSAAIDARHPGPVVVMAETAFLANGSVRVVFIGDRIEVADFEIIAIHELGHVIGFDDLPVYGAVMSAAQIRGIAPPADFTAYDLEHCRSVRYCD